MFAIAVAVPLAVELLNRALKRHRYETTTETGETGYEPECPVTLSQIAVSLDSKPSSQQVAVARPEPFRAELVLDDVPA